MIFIAFSCLKSGFVPHKKLSCFALLLLRGFKKLFQVEKVSGIQTEDIENPSGRPMQLQTGGTALIALHFGMEESCFRDGNAFCKA